MTGAAAIWVTSRHATDRRVSAGAAAPGATAGELARYRWSELSPAPIPARDGVSATWSGSELLVWGGHSGRSGETLHGDGAAYDPAQQRWRVLPESRLGPRDQQSSVWTGRQWIIWGGYDLVSMTQFHVVASGASYDAAADRWKALPASPLSARAAAAGVWAGREAILFGGYPAVRTDSVRALTDAAAYDPAADRWRMLPALPLVAGHDYDVPTGVWAGDRLLVWWPWSHTQQTSANSSIGTSGYDLFAYTPSDDQWRLVPEQPKSSFGVADPIWTGTYVLSPASEPYRGGASGPAPMALRGGRYDALQNRWEPISHGPVDDMARTDLWTGGALVRMSSGTISGPSVDGTSDVHPGDTAAWDPVTDAWTKLPRAPFTPGYKGALVWTGREILSWGLYSPAGTQLSTPTNAGMRFGP
jgi:hypothetical protein